MDASNRVDDEDAAAPVDLVPADAAAEEAERAWLVLEEERAKEAVEWLSSRPQAKRVAPFIDAKPADLTTYQARICHSLGSASFNFCDRIIRQLLNAPGCTTQAERESLANEGLQFIAAYGPESEIETTVLLQAWMTHLNAVTVQRRLGTAENVPQLEAYGTIAVKLGKLYIQQIEALPRMKPAKQVIEVQHVHIYPGSEAVIRTADRPARFLTQPHVQVTDARELAVWGEDPERETVSGPGDHGAETLPISRRDEPGSTEG